MAELKAKTPYETITGGAAGPEEMHVEPFVLREVALGPITEIAPFRGRRAALSKAMKTAHGVCFPEPGRRETSGPSEALWFGRETALLIGVPAEAGLADHAALTDQSDGWASVELEGPDVEEVLARLVPIDLRSAHFDGSATARTLLGHMACSVSRTGPERFRLMVFRSMAKTLFRELHHAMIGVSARKKGVGGG